MGNMSDALRGAGFQVNVEEVKEIQTIDEVKLPFLVDNSLFGTIRFREIKDINFINKNKKDLDIDWFKSNVKPFGYDKLYKWILENYQEVRIVTKGTVHRRVVGQERLYYTGAVINNVEYYTDTEYGYSCLGFYMYWDPFIRRIKFTTSMDFSLKYFKNDSSIYGVAENVDKALEVLNSFKDKSMFIPLVLDELHESGVRFNNPGKLSNMASSLGVCILEDSHMQSFFKGLDQKPFINPKVYYFVIQKKDLGTDEISYQFVRDTVKSPRRNQG